MCPGTSNAPKKSTHPSDSVKYPDTYPPVCSGDTETEKSQGAANAGIAVATINAIISAAVERTKSMRLMLSATSFSKGGPRQSRHRLRNIFTISEKQQICQEVGVMGRPRRLYSPKTSESFYSRKLTHRSIS